MARRSLFTNSGSFSGGRKLADGEMDITPMIDVTFLLLIFFMVASTMQGTPDIDVPPAVHTVEDNLREGKKKIVLKAEGDVLHGLVDDVAQTIKAVEGSELYMGVGSKPDE